MDFLEFLDDHSGSITALATILLALVTAGYVVLTTRLVRLQHLGAKREIVDRIHKPLNAQLAALLSGSWPRHLAVTWNRMKENDPFLAFHHLVPGAIRRELDDLADACDSRQESYWELVYGIGAAAARLLDFRLDQPLDRPRVSIHQSSLDGLSLDEAVVGLTDMSHRLRQWGIDTVDKVNLQLWESGRIANEKELTADSVRDFLEQLQSAVIIDPALKGLLDQHHAFLRAVERVLHMVRQEIERGSRL